MTTTTTATRAVPEAGAARLLLTLIIFVPYALGWLAGAAVATCAWSVAAIRVGWQDGRRTGGGHPNDGMIMRPS